MMALTREQLFALRAWAEGLPRNPTDACWLALLDEHAYLTRQLAERDERVRELTAERDLLRMANDGLQRKLRVEVGVEAVAGTCVHCGASPDHARPEHVLGGSYVASIGKTLTQSTGALKKDREGADGRQDDCADVLADRSGEPPLATVTSPVLPTDAEYEARVDRMLKTARRSKRGCPVCGAPPGFLGTGEGCPGLGDGRPCPVGGRKTGGG
jgi:hypothetical protein